MGGSFGCKTTGDNVLDSAFLVTVLVLTITDISRAELSVMRQAGRLVGRLKHRECRLWKACLGVAGLTVSVGSCRSSVRSFNLPLSCVGFANSL